MTEVTENSLSTELRELQELLTNTVPVYATKRQEIMMPAATAPWMAMFWKAVGWLDDYEDLLTRPDDAEAHGQALALFEEWRADDARGDGSYDRLLEQLPACYRVVAIDDEHVTVADETEDGYDLPLCVVYGPSTDAEEVFVERLSATYLPHVTRAVLESVRHRTPWKGSLAGSLPSFAEVLPSLMPGSRRSGTVWLVAIPQDEAPASAQFDLRAPTISALVAFFEQLGPSTQFRWTAHDAPTRRARRLPLPNTLRQWTMVEPFRHVFYAGVLEQAPVLIVAPTSADDRLEIYCEPADVPAIDRWFERHRPMSKG